MFYIQFFYWKNERIAHFLFFGERCEWIAHFAQIKWAMWANCSGRSPKMSDVSESLRSLTKNEQPWAIRSGRSEEMSHRERIAHVCSPKMSKWVNCSIFLANRSFAHFWAKKERFSRKTDERSPSSVTMWPPTSLWSAMGAMGSLSSSTPYKQVNTLGAIPKLVSTGGYLCNTS